MNTGKAAMASSRRARCCRAVKSQPVIRASRTKPGTAATVEVELRRGVLRIHDADAALFNALVVALSA